MIRRAVERGVTPERLAKSLELDIEHITKKINLLAGICAEAVRLLKDKHFSANLSPVLRKMKPTRQVECVELMVATNNITVSYAQALLAATPSNMLVNEGVAKKIKGVTPDQMAKMEREMANLEGQFKLVEQSYGQDVLNLVLAKGYLTKLLDNEAVIRFLSQNLSLIHISWISSMAWPNAYGLGEPHEKRVPIQQLANDSDRQNRGTQLA